MKKNYILVNLLSTLSVASLVGMNAFATNDVNDVSQYYYDVKKASDYALTFCGANKDITKGEYKAYEKNFESKQNNEYRKQDANCTSYISQILYYGGYKMKGIPSLSFQTGCVSYDPEDWFYYCLEDNFGKDTDVWSSSWTVVGEFLYLIPSGLYTHFTAPYIYQTSLVSYKYLTEDVNYICSSQSELKYCDDFAKKYNLKRGDIIQVGDDSPLPGVQYGHSLYVWCTEPEIRVCSNSDNYFARKLSEIDEAEDGYYRILRTNDHAIQKSVW